MIFIREYSLLISDTIQQLRNLSKKWLVLNMYFALITIWETVRMWNRKTHNPKPKNQFHKFILITLLHQPLEDYWIWLKSRKPMIVMLHLGKDHNFFLVSLCIFCKLFTGSDQEFLISFLSKNCEKRKMEFGIRCRIQWKANWLWKDVPKWGITIIGFWLLSQIQ